MSAHRLFVCLFVCFTFFGGFFCLFIDLFVCFSLPQSTGLLDWNRAQAVAVSGVVVTQNHIETALEQLHSSHSEAIGAPKVS